MAIAERMRDDLKPMDEEPEVLLWRGGYSARAMYASWTLASLFTLVVGGLCFGVFRKLDLATQFSLR